MKRETLKEAIEQVLMLDEVASEKTLKRVAEMLTNKFITALNYKIRIDKSTVKSYERKISENLIAFHVTFETMNEWKKAQITRYNDIIREEIDKFRRAVNNMDFLRGHNFSFLVGKKGNLYQVDGQKVDVCLGYYRTDDYRDRVDTKGTKEGNIKILLHYLEHFDKDKEISLFREKSYITNFSDLGIISPELSKLYKNALNCMGKFDEKYKHRFKDLDDLKTTVKELNEIIEGIEKFKKEFDKEKVKEKAEKMLKDLETPQ